MDPSKYTGRAAYQVDHFLAEVVAPGSGEKQGHSGSKSRD